MKLALITDGNTRFATALLARQPLACVIDFSPQSLLRFRAPSYAKLRWRCWRAGTRYYHLDRQQKPQAAQWLQSQQITIALSYYAPLLPESVIQAPRLGILNLHPSVLPRYRGADPLLWQVIAGETPLGSTVHLIDNRIDTGPIIHQASIEVSYPISRRELEERLIHQLGIELLLQASKTVAKANHKAVGQAQSPRSPTPYAKRIRAEQWRQALPWQTLSQAQLHRLAHYLEYWPEELIDTDTPWQGYCRWQTQGPVEPLGEQNWQLRYRRPLWWLQTPAGQVALKPRWQPKHLLKHGLSVLIKRYKRL